MRLRRKKKIWMSCALAKASTTMPGRLVMATPATTCGHHRVSHRERVVPSLHPWVTGSTPGCPRGRAAPTLLPMVTVASAARSTRVGLVLWAKAQVRWDTNSTEMPTACGDSGVTGEGTRGWLPGAGMGQDGGRRGAPTVLVHPTCPRSSSCCPSVSPGPCATAGSTKPPRSSCHFVCPVSPRHLCHLLCSPRSPCATSRVPQMPVPPPAPRVPVPPRVPRTATRLMRATAL